MDYRILNHFLNSLLSPCCQTLWRVHKKYVVPAHPKQGWMGGLRNGTAEESCTAKAEIHEARAGYLSCSHERREVSGLQGNKQNNNLSFLLLPPLLHWFPVTFQVCLVPPNAAEGVCLHRLPHHLGHSTVVLDVSVSGLIIWHCLKIPL